MTPIRYESNISEPSRRKLASLIALKKELEETLSSGEVIAALAASFLGTPYQDHTLIGSPATPEVLVVNLEALDCFTFLDYVLALSRARGEKSFFRALIRTRYIKSQVNFFARKHFFSDWVARSPRNAREITPTLKGAVRIRKILNQGEKNRPYIPGLNAIPRELTYLPPARIDSALVASLETGDFIGIYSPLSGLDVSHVGILVKQQGGAVLRHASSLAACRRVVDVDFLTYCRQKPGIMIFRAEARTGPQKRHSV